MFEAASRQHSHREITRLVIAVGVSTLLCAGAAGALVSIGSAPPPPPAPREIDVVLAAPPKPVPPPPAPPPPVPATAPPSKPKATKPRPAAPKPKPAKLVEPTLIPQEKPPEAEPAELAPVEAVEGPVSDGAAFEPGADTAPQPAAEPVRRVAAPIDLPEDAEPAMPVEGNATPVFPEEARARGLEGVVILRLVVTLDGSVTNVRVLRGDEPFAAAAVAAVRTWRYSPARVDGQPVASFKTVRIPFRIR